MKNTQVFVLVAYFLVSFLVALSNLAAFGRVGTIAVMPGVVSVLLLIPLWIWYKRYSKKRKLSKEMKTESVTAVISSISALFLLALVVRIPMVLNFGMAYEKTPIVYLVILWAVVSLGCDASVFGFKTDNFFRAVLLGVVYFVFVGLLPYMLIGVGFYLLSGQLLIEGFDLLPFLFTLPFMTLCVGVSEEGLFRGFMQTELGGVFSRRKAILVQALLFGLWHFIWHVKPMDWFGMFGHIGSTFVIGLLFGYFYGIAGSITSLVLAHGLIDSVPEGFVQNQSASASMQSLPFSTLLLLEVVPYIFGLILAFALTKFLIEAFMPH